MVTTEDLREFFLEEVLESFLEEVDLFLVFLGLALFRGVEGLFRLELRDRGVELLCLIRANLLLSSSQVSL